MKQAEKLRAELIERLEPLLRGSDLDIKLLRTEIHKQLGYVIFVSRTWDGDISPEKVIGNFHIKNTDARKAFNNIRQEVAEIVVSVLAEASAGRETSLKSESRQESKAVNWLNKSNVKLLAARLGENFSAFTGDRDGLACLSAWAQRIKNQRIAEVSQADPDKPIPSFATAVSFREVYDFMMHEVTGREKREAPESDSKIPKAAVVKLFASYLSAKYDCDENEIDFSNPQWQEKLVQWAMEEKLWLHSYREKLERYSVEYPGIGAVTLYACLFQYSFIDTPGAYCGFPTFYEAFKQLCKDYFGFNHEHVKRTIHKEAQKRYAREYKDAKKREFDQEHKGKMWRKIPEEILLDENNLREGIRQAFGLKNCNFESPEARRKIFSTSLNELGAKKITINDFCAFRFDMFLKAGRNSRDYTLGKIWRRILINVCGFREEEVPRIKWGPDYHGKTDLQKRAFMLAFGFDDNTDFNDPKTRQTLKNPPAEVFSRVLDVDFDLKPITLAHFCMILGMERSEKIRFHVELQQKGCLVVSVRGYECLVKVVAGRSIKADIPYQSVQIAESQSRFLRTNE